MATSLSAKRSSSPSGEKMFCDAFDLEQRCKPRCTSRAGVTFFSKKVTKEGCRDRNARKIPAHDPEIRRFRSLESQIAGLKSREELPSLKPDDLDSTLRPQTRTPRTGDVEAAMLFDARLCRTDCQSVRHRAGRRFRPERIAIITHDRISPK